MLVATGHRVRSWRERLAGPAAVGGAAGVLAVHDVGGYGQHRLGVQRTPVGLVLAHLVHESTHEPDRDLVGAVVVVVISRELALGDVAGDEAGVVAHWPDRRVPDGGQGVGGDR